MTAVFLKSLIGEDLYNKKQNLIKEIVLELKRLAQESGEEEISALLHDELELSFGSWLVECSEWYAIVLELAKEETEDSFEDSIESVISDVQHDVRMLYQEL